VVLQDELGQEAIADYRWPSAPGLMRISGFHLRRRAARRSRVDRAGARDPKNEIRFVITTSDKVIAWRLRLDSLQRGEPCLLNTFRHRFAGGEQGQTNEKRQ